ncbi:hypothetical protein ACQ86N_25645 [Puia sp. P3]|uniref:baeRF3 domain-containing protein n=1 Tax=Puia sp. P3 TaxID=3423952 RepID=UPI003D67F636
MLPTPVISTPSAVLVAPFNPKMTPRQDLESTVKSLLIKAERQLMATHSAEDALPVVSKLRQLVRGLDYSTHRKSIAIFASRQTGNTCYMDTEVEQQLVIDQPFRVRDLAETAKKVKEYLVMVLDSHQSRTWLGRDQHLRLIKSNTPQSTTSNIFIHQMDQGLGSVLKVYPLPVFIVGPAQTTDFFARITNHHEHIAAYLHKAPSEITESRLQDWLSPELDAWDSLQQRMILQQIGKARTSGKLVCGMDNVRKAAGSKNNRLLVIPRDSEPGSFCKAGPIDEIAEKVLANGGAVGTVDRALLEEFENIVLIRYC